MKKYTSEIVLLMSFAWILAAVTLISFSIGRYSIPVNDILKYLFTGVCRDENLPILIFQVRMPRIIGAILAGGALAVSGAACQGLFRNPMVSPDILGVCHGAGFGASLAMVLSMGIAGIQLSAFVAGVGATVLALSISRILSRNHDKILMLVLSGMVVGTLFSALISLMKYIADSESKLPDITFWLMGNLSGITQKELSIVIPIVLLALIPLLLNSWKLNVLSFGEEEAAALGVNTGQTRIIIIVCASLITASVVCITGIVGWVGLIIPHVTRFIIGPNHRILLPASFLLGGIFLLLVDDLARSVASLEIPLGIITSLVGAPMFFILLKVSSKKVW
ncbi:MAG: iron ABC transporter permease [Tannerella sp.]|jgi:iron complex transport system permease protein|nr:iron ABC transporter permease [Tannerella sp.]